MSEQEAIAIAKNIYIHHFDDDINYPEVLKAITAGVQKGEAFNLDNSLKSLTLIDQLLHVVDDIASAEDVCLGPWEEEIEQAKAFLAQYNVHEKYCFDCVNICYGCSNKKMWRKDL